jgi:hypothetical protein
MALSYISEEQVRLYESAGTVYLTNYLDKAQTYQSAFSETRVVTPSSAQYVLVPSTIVSGNLAIGTTTVTRNGGIFATQLAGSVGTAATSKTSLANGDILNLVNIRDATTHDPILDSGREVYGLIQVSSSVVDGDAITGSGSENTQISFVKDDGTGTLTLVTLNQSVEFTINLIFSSRNVVDLKKSGGNVDQDVIQTSVPARTNTYYTVTADFAIGETINLSTGSGTGSGLSTKDGVTPSLPTTAAIFKSNGNVAVSRNGIEGTKGVGNDFEWVSVSSVKTNRKIKTGEVIQVKAQDSYS